MALNQNFSDFFDQPAAAPKPAQPKPAAPAPAAPTDKFSGVPAWGDIQSKPEFQALPPAKQAEAKAAYFDYWIAPRVGQDAGTIRQQFLGQQAPAAAPKPGPTETPEIEPTNEVGPEFGGPAPLTTPTASQPSDGILGTARNLAAGVLKIGPTAVKGAADIARLATGDRIGRDTSEAMQRGMKSIDEVVGTARFNEQQRGFEAVMRDDSKGVGDMFSYLLDNPAVLVDNTITTIGSMFLPAGAAKGAAVGARAAGLGQAATTKAAMVATLGTVASQNAADTFAELEKLPLDQRYQGAAVSFSISLLAGIAARGGAEGEIARRLAGDLQAGRGSLQAVKQFLGAVFREAGQEAGEEAGNIAGEATGRRELPSATSAGKRVSFAGTLGGVMGGGVNLASQAIPPEQAPAPTPAPTAADVTVDGRIEPTIDIGNLPADTGTTPTVDPLVQTADDIVRGMAADAGLPESTVLPTSGPTAPATPALTQADQDILDFAGTRFQQLRDKQGTPDEPGPGLSATESQEFQALVQARGNPTALRAFYGIDQPGEADVRQTEEPLDGAPSGPAAGAQGQAAAGSAQVPEQPGQQPDEDGQAQGLNQAIDGLGALFGQETEAQREARMEREAIQGESEMQGAGQQADDNIPFDLPPPRTEKEARERKEQQANVQAGQAQQAETPREEAVSAPTAPPAGGAEAGVGTGSEKTTPVVPVGFAYSLTSSPAYEGVEPLSVDDADFELEALQNSAEKGRLTPEQFAQSEVGRRLDTGQMTVINKGLRIDPVGTIKALRERLNQPSATAPAAAPKPKTEKEAKQQKAKPAAVAEAEIDALADRLEKLEKDFPGESRKIQNKIDLWFYDDKIDAKEIESGIEELEQKKERIEALRSEFKTQRENLRRQDADLRTSLLDPANRNRQEEINAQLEVIGNEVTAAYEKLEADIETVKKGEPKPKPKTEKEARQQRLADKPLPEWTQKTQNFPANTTFAWEQNGDNVVLVAKVGDKEFGRVLEGEAKTGASFGTMRLQKALLDESLRQAGGDTNLNWTPEGGDTSVEDKKQRQDERTEKRSRASRQLDEAIKKADEAGATATKSKLVDLRMAFDRKDKGPGQVLKALESVDSDIEKETQAQGGATSPEGAGSSQPTPAAPKTEAEAKQQRKAQFQDALDQEYNNGFESNNPAGNPVLRSKQDLEADYGPLTDQQVDQLRAAYAQGQAENDAAEGAGATKPTPTPAAPAPDLKGVKVKFDVMVEDTGQTASMTVDAASQMKEYDERESVLRELIACLQK